MGYSNADAAAAYAATSSTNVGRCAEWLLNKRAQAHTSAYAVTPPPRVVPGPGFYPDVNLTAPVAAPSNIQSHPVDFSPPLSLYGPHTPGFGALEDEFYSNPVAGAWHTGPGGTAQAPPVQPHKYTGIAQLINSKQAEAQQMSQQVHSGFKDLEVRHPVAKCNFLENYPRDILLCSGPRLSPLLGTSFGTHCQHMNTGPVAFHHVTFTRAHNKATPIENMSLFPATGICLSSLQCNPRC
jgi:hypothetical protein